MGDLGPTECFAVGHSLVGRQGPLAHLGIRGRRDVDPPHRRLPLEPGRRRGGGQPACVRLEGLEEPLDPAAIAPAVLAGGRPAAELLTVIAHDPEPVARLGRMVGEVADHVVDVPERDPVAKTLLGPEDRHETALVLGRVGAPHLGLGDRGRTEVGVVEDRPFVAGGDEGRRDVGLPDALGQPGAAWSRPECRHELVGHPDQLADAVALRQRSEDGLVPTPAEDLDLPLRDERGEPRDERWLLGPQPRQEWTRVVQ